MATSPTQRTLRWCKSRGWNPLNWSTKFHLPLHPDRSIYAFWVTVSESGLRQDLFGYGQLYSIQHKYRDKIPERGFYTSSPYAAIQLAILTALVVHFVRILIDRKTMADPGASIPYFNFAPLLGLILINHLFVISIGGDWMEFFRLIVPVVPFLVILTTCFAFRIFNAVLEKHILSRLHLEVPANLALGVLFLVAIATNSGQRDNYEMSGRRFAKEETNLQEGGCK